MGARTRARTKTTTRAARARSTTRTTPAPEEPPLSRTLNRIALLGLVALGAAAAVLALRPRPVQVETARATRGPMRVTVDEDGRTRIKERYTITAPLAGQMGRIELEEGDEVRAGETVLVSIDPVDPSLLDPRSRAEADARVRAAEAALERAGAMLERANDELELAQTEHTRMKAAAEDDAVSGVELRRMATLESVRLRDREAAESAQDVARFELELARAALTRTSSGDGGGGDWRLDILAPVDGRVLRVMHESSGVVQPGTPLLEVGDPTDIELVVDVLSSDGVAIRPGAPVSLERWGGPKPLLGTVRRVEPQGFTKISALGVEEERVNVIIDFDDPPEARQGLGDGYRVEARIETWRGDDVLTVPEGALFRHGREWALFVVEGGEARQRAVDVGHRNGEIAEVRAGVAADTEVIVYPSDRVGEGARVTPRS